MTNLPLLPLLLADVPPALPRALDQEGVPTALHKVEPKAGRFVLFDSRLRACPELADGQRPIDLHRLQADFDEDPLAALDDERSRRQSWQVGHLEVSEEVARVDKRAVRARFMEGLRQAVEMAGGVWLRLSAYPFPYRSAFSFRVDHDAYVPRDFDAFCEAIVGQESSFSHFVCASTFVEHRDELARLRGGDIGSHGFYHHTYLDPQENRANVTRGIEWLRGAGFEPSGFVAPHGRFNKGLLSVLDELSVSHSSEFSLAYDDLPFELPGSSVLQIPVHPICLGICLEAANRVAKGNPAAQRAAADAMRDYFQWIAHAKYQAGEPIFLYGHPDGRLGRWPHVLRGLLTTVDEFAAVWRVTMSEFARWWRARRLTKLRLLAEADRYVIHVDRQPEGYRGCVEYWRGEHVAPMPLRSARFEFSPQALAFQSRKPRPLPDQLRIDRGHTLRESMLRYLDWEKATPVEQIGTRTWRGWLKRTLRKIRS